MHDLFLPLLGAALFGISLDVLSRRHIKRFTRVNICSGNKVVKTYVLEQSRKEAIKTLGLRPASHKDCRGKWVQLCTFTAPSFVELETLQARHEAGHKWSNHKF
jgi:hypothetical protein